MMNEAISRPDQLPFPELEQKLKNCLQGLLTCLSHDALPSQEMCLEARNALCAYMAAPKPDLYADLEKAVGIHTKVEPFCEDIPGQKTLLENAEQVPGGWEILFRLGLENLLPAEDPCFQTPGGQQLIEEHYTSPVTVAMNGETHIFYTLSEKGWTCHQARKAHTSGKNNGTSLLQQVPKGMIKGSSFWNPLTLLRAVLLQDYFTENGKKQHFLLFSHPDAAELLLGCRIGSTPETEYACACVFLEDPSESELQAIRETAVSKSSDRLTLLFLRDEDAAKVRDNLSQESLGASNIQFRVMEVSHE